jgi:hypothetical protein
MFFVMSAVGDGCLLDVGGIGPPLLAISWSNLGYCESRLLSQFDMPEYSNDFTDIFASYKHMPDLFSQPSTTSWPGTGSNSTTLTET